MPRTPHAKYEPSISFGYPIKSGTRRDAPIIFSGHLRISHSHFSVAARHCGENSSFIKIQRDAAAVTVSRRYSRKMRAVRVASLVSSSREASERTTDRSVGRPPFYELRFRPSQLSAKNSEHTRRGGESLARARGYGIGFELISATGGIKNGIDLPSISAARAASPGLGFFMCACTLRVFLSFFFYFFFVFSLPIPFERADSRLSSRAFVARRATAF